MNEGYFAFRSAAVLIVSAAAGQTAPQAQLTVTAVNKLKIARPSETIEITADTLAPLGEKDLTKIHVRDGAGKEVLAQAVDTDYDDFHKPDLLIFQAASCGNVLTTSPGKTIASLTALTEKP